MELTEQHSNIRAIEAQINALPCPSNDCEWVNGFAEKDALDAKILDLIFEASDFSLRKNGCMQFNYVMAYVINYHRAGGWLAVLDEFEHAGMNQRKGWFKSARFLGRESVRLSLFMCLWCLWAGKFKKSLFS